jgi:phosphomannomutase
MAIRVGTTGARGRYQELTPDIALKLSRAFATYLGKGNIALARDTRPSGLFLSEAARSGLMSTGARVFDYSFLPTPVLQWIIRYHQFKGGISISAAHNTFDWNCLIFLGPDGSYLNLIEVEEFLNLYHSGKFSSANYDKIGVCSKTTRYIDEYFKSLRKHFKVERTPRLFKFFIDNSYGVSDRVMTQFAKNVNSKITSLFTKNARNYYKNPEPNLHNAQILATVVGETDCDGGFLFNTDGTRVLIVDEFGKAYSEELTLPVFARIILESNKTNIVTTYSTSRLLQKIARQFQVKVFQTDVGPPAVIKKAKDLKAEIAGEGSGSIAYTPFSYGYDNFFFITKLIEFLNNQKISLSELLADFSNPLIYKETYFPPSTRIYNVLNQFARHFKKKTKLKDGFYFEEGKDWVCIRVSSTKSMIRIMGEGDSLKQRVELLKDMIL